METAASPHLTIEQAHECAERVRNLPPGSPEWRTANDALIVGNMGLAVKLGRKYAQPLVRYEAQYEDVVQDSFVGLMLAAQKYEAGHGANFATYAAWWIRACATNGALHQRSDLRIASNMMTLYLVLRRETEAFIKKRRRPPTDKEISKKTGISMKRIERINRYLAQRTVGMDDPVGRGRNGDPITVGERLAAQPSNDVDRIEERERSAALAEAMATLDERERFIIRHGYGLADRHGTEQTDVWCGKQLGLSRERARQLRQRAEWKLRCFLTGEQTPRPDYHGAKSATVTSLRKGRKGKRKRAKNKGSTRAPRKRKAA